MTGLPIIFSAPMVRAILAGRKTQTRRLLKLQEAWHAYRLATYDPSGEAFFASDYTGTLQKVRLPYAPGDRLWVREAWSMNALGGQSIGGVGDWDYRLEFRSGGAKPLRFSGHHTEDPYMRLYDSQVGEWRSPIHMPRWASRLTLTVSDVRVQRVQEISDADALAEGMHQSDGAPGSMGPTQMVVEARNEFRHLWDDLHGPGAWGANPWVVALTFTVQRRNIDAVAPCP